MRVSVPVVEELEVVEVDDDDRQRLVVARRRAHRARELVLEGSLVGQVGQAVARRTRERDAMAAQQRAPADEVEDGRPGEEREQPDPHQCPPDAAEVGVEDAVVVADLERRSARRGRWTGAMNSKSRASAFVPASSPA